MTQHLHNIWNLVKYVLTLLVANTPITPATKTKITYDANGLVTFGDDATTADINSSLNRRYLTDAQLVVVGNTSGTNSGNETATTIGALLVTDTTPLDTDSVVIWDGTFLMKTTWTNLKAFLKIYNDTLYATISDLALKAPLISPTFTTPILGVAKATSINTGTTLDGVGFFKSISPVSLTSVLHALTVGDEASGLNIAFGLYGSLLAIQARNNGAAESMYIQPLGGSISIGYGALTGQRILAVNNSGSGTLDYASIEVRNGSAGNDALRLWCMGTGFTTSGSNVQDSAIVTAGPGLSGGMSLGTLANASLRVYTNNILRIEIDGNGNLASTGKIVSSGGGIGYKTGAGGSVTQGTSKSTGVTLSKLTGNITTHAAALAAATIVSFVLTNTFIEATDLLVIQHVSGGTVGAYTITANCAAGSATIYIRNNTAGSLSQALVLKFALIKATIT